MIATANKLSIDIAIYSAVDHVTVIPICNIIIYHVWIIIVYFNDYYYDAYICSADMTNTEHNDLFSKCVELTFGTVTLVHIRERLCIMARFINVLIIIIISIVYKEINISACRCACQWIYKWTRINARCIWLK